MTARWRRQMARALGAGPQRLIFASAPARWGRVVRPHRSRDPPQTGPDPRLLPPRNVAVYADIEGRSAGLRRQQHVVDAHPWFVCHAPA